MDQVNKNQWLQWIITKTDSQFPLGSDLTILQSFYFFLTQQFKIIIALVRLSQSRLTGNFFFFLVQLKVQFKVYFYIRSSVSRFFSWVPYISRMRWTHLCGSHWEEHPTLLWDVYKLGILMLNLPASEGFVLTQWHITEKKLWKA